MVVYLFYANLILLALYFLLLISTVHSIGVNYGILGNNLPLPSQVAKFLEERTSIDRIKIFNVDSNILQCFANTGILVAVTAPNDQIPKLTDVHNAGRWIAANIKPYYPQTKINYILVGNEILRWGTLDIINNLFPAMKSLHKALKQEGLQDIKVTTAHSLDILEPSPFPSMAKFRSGWDKAILAPMLQFHRDTRSPLMVNPYPYHGYTPELEDFAIFKPNKGVFDNVTTYVYHNMFDMQLDSVNVSMMKLGFSDVEIVVGETGWASKGETSKCSLTNAKYYNSGLVKKYELGIGTPLMPNRSFETYIFTLFNENQKPGSSAERNFGLFRPDFTPVYDVGIMHSPPSTSSPKLMALSWNFFILFCIYGILINRKV